MGEVDIVTVSSKGQISIPSEIRKQMKIEKGTKLLVFSEGENLLFKKIDTSVIEKDLDEILEPMWEKAEEEGLDEEDVEELVHESRGVDE